MSKLNLPKDEIFASINNGNLDNLKRLITPELANLKDRSSHTLLYQATQSDKPDIVKWLISMGADVNMHCNGHTATSLALAKSNFALFQYFIDEAHADCRSKNQLNLLHEAANKNRQDIVELLINKGADPNQLNNAQITPLSIAIAHKNHQMCRYLLDNGASVNLPDKKGNTALHAACQLGDFELVDLLVSNTECDMNMKNQNEETALDLLWVTTLKEASDQCALIEKFIEMGGMFSMPWNFTFTSHNHVVFIKSLALLCRFRLMDLFVNERRIFNNLVIRGFWRNALIVSIKAAILDAKVQASVDEQVEIFRCVEQIALSGEMRLSANELIATFNAFEEITELELFKRLNRLLTTPLSLKNLARIELRKCLQSMDETTLHDTLKIVEDLRKFLVFDNSKSES